MTWRPTWPEVLSLFEEPRFQVAVVALVAVAGAIAIAITLPRPGALSTGVTAPSAVDASARTVAGPAPSERDDEQAEPDAVVSVSRTPSDARPARAAATDAPALAFSAGDRAQLVAPSRIRLTCSEIDDARPGILFAGQQVEVIEVGTSMCAGWILAHSEVGLTWLRPSVLEAVDVPDVTSGSPHR